jgi:hypothetical protein
VAGVLIPTVRHVREVGKRNTDSQVYVGRRTKWGNPYRIGEHGTREEVIKLFERMFYEDTNLMRLARIELKGKDLVCWCAPEACHADVLLEYANRED